jgi:hypothetical protein
VRRVTTVIEKWDRISKAKFLEENADDAIGKKIVNCGIRIQTSKHWPAILGCVNAH